MLGRMLERELSPPHVVPTSDLVAYVAVDAQRLEAESLVEAYAAFVRESNLRCASQLPP